MAVDNGARQLSPTSELSSTPDSASSTPKRPKRSAPGRTVQSQEAWNEQSPLLAAVERRDSDISTLGRDGLPEQLEYKDEEEEEKGKSTWYLFILTLSIGGLQIAWAVELSNGSPYLLSLGMSKSLLALVWIAGPLSGTLVQPYVGIQSDNCRISWGKRKPFMLGGAAATIVSLICLAWTREIIHGIGSVFGADPASTATKWSAIVFAILFVYILDFAINTVQAGIRAFIVDNAPAHQQEDANAWAGRITGFGNIIGYLAGYVNLPEIMPFFGKTQFQVLCVIACIALGGTVLISCLCIRERDPRLEGPPKESGSGVIAFFKHTFRSLLRLPPQIRRVCEVQFFAWIGWFPFLFYITTYVGQLYVNPIFEANPHMSEEEINDAWESATRVGTFALLIFAITSFASNILLPFVVVPTYRASGRRRPSTMTPLNRPTTPTTPSHMMSGSMTSYFPTPSTETHSRLTRLLSALQIPHLTLRRAWLISHILFALATFCTFLVSTPTGGTVLVGMIGVPWALTLWAPFALISAEISTRDAERRKRKFRRLPGSEHARVLDEEEDDQAGVILGLHNVAVAAPQVLATVVSSAIFRVLQKERGVPGDESTGWVLRFGGCAALIAAYMTTRVGEQGDGRARGVDDRGEVDGV